MNKTQSDKIKFGAHKELRSIESIEDDLEDIHNHINLILSGMINVSEYELNRLNAIKCKVERILGWL